ncbi:hypothetical protein BGX31_000676 [Mortierella sp. GBA43]|nr:hypothetical protein BGX31_000676 [Mortierella sp. GBA43]
MSRPIFQGDDGLSKHIAGVHQFFYDHHPSEWDPVLFAQHKESTTTRVFKDSLKLISQTDSNVTAYARQYRQYLKSDEGIARLNQAQGHILRKQNIHDEAQTGTEYYSMNKGLGFQDNSCELLPCGGFPSHEAECDRVGEGGSDGDEDESYDEDDDLYQSDDVDGNQEDEGDDVEDVTEHDIRDDGKEDGDSGIEEDADGDDRDDGDDGSASSRVRVKSEQQDFDILAQGSDYVHQGLRGIDPKILADDKSVLSQDDLQASLGVGVDFEEEPKAKRRRKRSESLDGTDSQDIEPRKRSATVSKARAKSKFKKASTYFDLKGQLEFQKRYEDLGEKWILETGTVVEDILFEAGNKCSIYNPVHSFMIDTHDPWIREFFTDDEWDEISNGRPTLDMDNETLHYIEQFDKVTTIEELEQCLSRYPKEFESALVHRTLTSCDQPHSLMLPGETSCLDSRLRRNIGRYSSHTGPQARLRVGAKADFIWRTMDGPAKDWGVVEASRTWDELGDKYITESSMKLPRQMHDILRSRTREVGALDLMRRAQVPGLFVGGPYVQRLSLCWGAKGENVTVLYRTSATRLFGTIENLSQSLDSFYNLLGFRIRIGLQRHSVGRVREKSASPQSTGADQRHGVPNIYCRHLREHCAVDYPTSWHGSI